MHLWHSVEPACSETYPGPHSMHHTGEVAPVASFAVPAGQSWHPPQLTWHSYASGVSASPPQLLNWPRPHDVLQVYEELTAEMSWPLLPS